MDYRCQRLLPPNKKKAISITKVKNEENKRRKRKILKENCCPIRSQLATRKKKKDGQAELARKLDASVSVTNFRALLTAYRARVQSYSLSS